MYINFSDIPGNSNLFLDYLYEFENVKEFYYHNFRDTAAYPSHFEKLKSNNYIQRDKITQIVRSQYAGRKISKQTENNINLLEENNTLAIVTGQQLGIFGGPLYTTYKIVTAVKLARHLKDNYDQYNFAPVFWLESDDHDFDEVRKFNLVDKENNLKQISYDDGLYPEINRGSAGNIKFNENLNFVFDQLIKDLRENDFKNELIELLRSFYKPGESFKSSFRNLIIDLFDEYGLIVFDPQANDAKQILKPIFGKEIELFNEHTDKVVNRSAELEELYSAQVKVKPINLFFSAPDGRYLIEPADDEYRLKGKRRRIPLEEFLDKLEDDPSKFSPNVLLRPICQDFLFPTAMYVAGPGEISYFAQVNPLYQVYGIIPPVIYPRSSATIIEKNHKNLFEKNQITFMDFYLDERILTGKIVDKVSQDNLNTLFDEALAKITGALSGIKSGLEEVDPTLADPAAKTEQRILQSIGLLKEKSFKANERKYETTLRQIEKARTVIYPHSNLQERELNLIYFASKYGFDIVRMIFNNLTINKFEHQLIEL